VIAASNRDIEKEVEKGNFRQDLMYRLNAVTIDLPPLRDRKEDISLLAEHFVREAALSRVNPPKFSDETIGIFQNYDWPGNIRELENAVLHAVSLSDDIIYAEHLPSRIRYSGTADRRAVPREARKEDSGHHRAETKWQTLAEMEKDYVEEVLAHAGSNKQAASRILNIDRKTLARIINRKPLN
jgi:two-component system response regulator AtoC